jgi:hypothetical protein
MVGYSSVIDIVFTFEPTAISAESSSPDPPRSPGQRPVKRRAAHVQKVGHILAMSKADCIRMSVSLFAPKAFSIRRDKQIEARFFSHDQQAQFLRNALTRE